MTLDQKKELFQQFASYMSSSRAKKIEQVAHNRTRSITVILEDIYQSHNISASLRSCDCFGIQDVHIIEQRHFYSINEAISKGANKWLDVYRYNDATGNNTEKCFSQLKSQGYTLVAATPHEHGYMIGTLPIDKKLAILFGTEESGLSSYASNNADLFVKIPMVGFTESFNISVSVALCLYEITKRMRDAGNCWKLSEDDIIDLQLDWLGRSTNRSQQIKALLAK